MLDYDIENELRPHLTSDEKLTWTGRIFNIECRSENQRRQDGTVFTSSFYILLFNIRYF
jgi:hypothetical protein